MPSIILNQSRPSTSAASAKSPLGDKAHSVGKNILTANAKRIQNLQTKQSNLKQNKPAVLPKPAVQLKKHPNGAKSKKKEIVSESHKKGSQNAVYVHNRYAALHDEGEGEWNRILFLKLHPSEAIYL